MKLTHLTIHNFRGVHDASLNLFDYNLLMGLNNAGKSTVIDAIRDFYEKDEFKYKHDRDFPFIAANGPGICPAGKPLFSRYQRRGAGEHRAT